MTLNGFRSQHVYRADIDGLRAIAVILVLGYHAFPSWFQSGFVGVDIFFVISGYLISSIIIDDVRSKNFSLLRFYQRRICRIFPALIIVLITSFVVGWFYFTGAELTILSKHIAAGAGFVSNLVLMKESGYFDTSAILKPLLHLWSLGVEEQFYIVLPLFLWFVTRINFNLKLAVLFVFMLSFVFSTVVYTDKVINFYSPQTRFWELLVGTLLATHRERLATDLKTQSFMSWIGVTCLILGVILIAKEKQVPSEWTVVTVVGTALLISAGGQTWFNKVILSNKLLVAVGLISYPLYLWHWPLLSFATIIGGNGLSVSQRLFALTVAVILATFTYIFLEKPIRNIVNKGRATKLLVLCMLGVGCVGYISYIKNGFPERRFAAMYQNITDAVDDWSGPNGLIPLPNYGPTAFTNDPTRSPELLFIGDSHIEQFYPRIVELTKDISFPPSLFITSGGCPPIPNVLEGKLDLCRDTYASIVRILNADHQIKKVVVGACWNCYFLQEIKPVEVTGSRFNYFYMKDAVRVPFRGGEGAELAIEELRRFLTTLSHRYKVYLLLDNPMGELFDPKNLIGNRVKLPREKALETSVKVPQEQIALNQRLKQLGEQSGAVNIDQMAALCKDGICSRMTESKKPYYKDAHHMRPFFVKEYGGYLEASILF